MFWKAFVIFVLFLTAVAAVPVFADSLVNEVDLSYQYNRYGYQFYKTEDINVAFDFRQIIAGNFYGNLSSGEFLRMTAVEFRIISSSKTAGDFFANLRDIQRAMSIEQKLLLLQRLGDYLEVNYNSAMLSGNQHVKISDDEMFSALRGYFINGKITSNGICGNIHTFLIKTAENLGIEAWLQSGITSGNNGHVFAGLVVERDNQKQIAFLDYKNLILTGTVRYDESLGVMERYFGQVGLFDSFVGTKDKVLFPVKSLATKKLEQAVGYMPVEETLSSYLAVGEINVPKSVLSLRTGNEMQEISYDSKYLGIAFVDFHDAGNPYNALDSFNAARGRLHFADKKMELELNTTIMNLNIKDLGSGILSQSEIVNILVLNYINNYNLAKGDYGRFALNFGATVEAGIRHIVGESLKKPAGGFGEGTTGARLVFISLNELSKIFIEAGGAFRGQLSDFQNQELVAKLASSQLKIGGSLKVGNAVIDLETALAKTDASLKESISLGFKSSRIKTAISYGKEIADFPRFFPDKEQVSGEVGYAFGVTEKLAGEFILYGSSIQEQYKDSLKHPSYETGALLKIFLW